MAREAENIGARMKEVREERGLKQREVAAQLPGKTEGKDISRWENAKHRPGPDTLVAIADALGTTVADLHAGPMSERKEKGPTPDPFAAATGSGEDAAVQLRELLLGQQALKTRLAKIERLLEDQQRQSEDPAQRRKGSGK